MTTPESVTTHSDNTDVKVKLVIKGFTTKKDKKEEIDLCVDLDMNVKHAAQMAGAVLVSSLKQMLEGFASHIKDSVAPPQEMEHELETCKHDVWLSAFNVELSRLHRLVDEIMLHPEHGKQ